MIQVTPQMRVLVATKPVDFRKGIDGLARICRAELREDPFSGCVFVFCNSRRNAVKLLIYDGQGFWLCQKRLSKGRFGFWPTGNGSGKQLESYQLSVLLSGGDPNIQGCEPWRRIN
jgi:transposase